MSCFPYRSATQSVSNNCKTGDSTTSGLVKSKVLDSDPTEHKEEKKGYGSDPNFYYTNLVLDNLNLEKNNSLITILDPDVLEYSECPFINVMPFLDLV